MGVNEWTDHRGKRRWYASRTWPDGRRYRRLQPARGVAKKVLARIEESIVMGTWRELREELEGDRSRQDPTFAEFSEIYLAEYAAVRNRRPDAKAQVVGRVLPIVGRIRIREFSRADAYRFVEVRSRQVKPATVNRGLAAIKNVLTFAIEKGLIETHPLQRFRMLPEPQKALQVLTLEEYRRLIACVWAADPTVGAYCQVLGETGLRKSEGLRLRWRDVDLGGRMLTVDGRSKSGKVRHVPLSDPAVEALAGLMRRVGVEEVFCQVGGRPWRDPRGPFSAGRKEAKLEWVGFHDLRHFRATQWVRGGMDLVTVKELLGHADISTTMRYAHFSDSHARRSVARIAASESEDGRKVDGTKTG